MLRKWHLFAIVALAGLFSVLISLWEGHAPEWAIFENSTSIVAALGTVVFVFDRWLWRIPALYPRLVSVPNVRGSWKAEADVQDLDPSRSGLLHGYIIIRQTHSSIAWTIYWADRCRVSEMVAEAPISASMGTCALAASYRRLPSGASEDFGMYFYWSKNSPTFTLYYRTSSGQTGKVRLSERKGRICTSFAEAESQAASSVPLLEKVTFVLAWK